MNGHKHTDPDTIVDSGTGQVYYYACKRTVGYYDSRGNYHELEPGAST